MSANKLRDLYTKLLYQDTLDLNEAGVRAFLQDLVGDEILGSRERITRGWVIYQLPRWLNEFADGRAMIERYEDEVKALKEKMTGVVKFAKKVPVFREFIFDNELDGTECDVRFADSYKSIPFVWGLYRGKFKSGTASRAIPSYKGSYDKYLFMVHISPQSLYGSHKKFGLEKVTEKSNVFFFDGTTFYVEDEHIEGFLEALNDWYEGAMVKLERYKRDEEVKELEERLARLKEANK